MNTEALFLFLILLLGLVLCSFLGGNCKGINNSYLLSESFQSNLDVSNNVYTRSDISNNIHNRYNTYTSNTNYDNYNHYNGSTSGLANGTTFYGPNGGTVVVTTNSDGTQSLQITLSSGQTPMTFTPRSNVDNSNNSTEGYTNYTGVYGSATTYYGPNGATATVIYGNNGEAAINVQTSSGSYTYTQSGSSYYNPNNTSSSTQYYGSTGYPIQSNNLAYYGPYGGSAGSVTGPYGNTAYYAQGPYGGTVAGTTNGYYNGTSSTQYYGPYGGSAGSVTGPYGNTAYYAQGPNGATVAGTTSNDYYSSLPPGIPASQIPPGDEDLYILKSQVVPPVCPVCPVNVTEREKPCPACPPCARCPEPSFECKKVPNYSAINNEYLPQPVLNDFSTFGM